MAKVHIDKPKLTDLCWFCIERFKAYHVFTGHDGRFYESDSIGSYAVPVNHVRSMLRRDLHASYFLTSREVSVVVDKVIEAIFDQAKKHAEKINNQH